jgi:uncharacterized OB-fold protein
MLEKIARPELIRRWEGDLPVRHRYTPGVAGDAFFTALKERGVLLGSRCEHCSYTYVPARLFCERCFAELAADTEVGPGGELVSFTIVFQGIEGEPLDQPETLGAFGSTADAPDHPARAWENRRDRRRVEVVVDPRTNVPGRSWISRVSVWSTRRE